MFTEYQPNMVCILKHTHLTHTSNLHYNGFEINFMNIYDYKHDLHLFVDAQLKYIMERIHNYD